MIRVGMVGTYQQHDLPLEVTKLISRGLVQVDLSNRFESDLAASWETNDDATQFSFKLKDDLKWSDNSPIKSQEVGFNIPDTELSTPDEHTIQFKLKESYSPFASLLTKPIFKKGTMIGTGPYKIAKIEKSRIFITKIKLVPISSDLPTVFIRFYPSEKVALTGFNMGEVQTLLGVSHLESLVGTPQIGFRQRTDFSKIVTILYNTKDPLLANRSLRQALSYSAPEIEGEEVANNPFPQNSWAYDGDSKKYLSNPKEAKSALERAEGALSSDKMDEELVLTTTSNLEHVAKLIGESWKELGFDVNLSVESGIPQNFQALLITQSIPQDPDQYFLWHSTQEKTNLTKYSSARIDKDLEDGRKATSEEERKQKYFDFQKTLLEDAPATFLYFPKYNIVYLKKVEPLLNKILPLQLPN